MAKKEVDISSIFHLYPITGEEAQRLAEIPHSALLVEAFKALTSELDAQGNSQRFRELRDQYSKKLLTYWQNKRMIFEKAKREGLVQHGTWGEECILGEERISVSQGIMEGPIDVVLLQIKRRSKIEEDEVSVSVDLESGLLEEVLYPPMIKSQIRTDPEEAPDIYYRVVFRKGKISTFERTLVCSDPQQEHPYIKDTRIIDCSLFGVEI